MLLSFLPASIRERLNTPGAWRFLLALGGAGLARGAQLVLAVVLARKLGASEYGGFTFAIGAATLASLFAAHGWPDLFNRLYPQYVREERWGLLRGFARLADSVVLSAGLVIGLILVAASMAAGPLKDGLLYAALLTTPMAVAALRRQQLAGVKLASVGLVFDQGFAAFLTVLVVLAFGLDSLTIVVGAYFVGSVVGVLVTSFFFFRAQPAETRSSMHQYDAGTWFRMVLPISVGGMARQMLNRIDVILLAPLATLEDVGLYGAAWRLTYLMSFPQIVLLTVMTPMLSEAYVHRDLAKIKHLMRLATLYAWVTTLPTLLIFLIAPSRVMTFVFGPTFSEAGTPLVMLGLAQFLTAFGVARSCLLVMGGKERAYGMINAGMLAATILLNLALIPLYGANGAAFVTLLSSVVLLALQHRQGTQVYRSLESPLDGDLPKGETPQQS